MKASLSLSVNAIVVFVLAFALLSVGLFFTNLVKDRIAEGALRAVDLNELKNPPSSDNPITIPSQVDIKRGKERRDLQIGFYNKANVIAQQATLRISKCVDSDRNQVEPDSIPKLAAVSIDVDSNSGVGFPVILKEQKLDQGTYICTLEVYSETMTDSQTPPNLLVFESKSFILVVGS